MRQFRLTDLKEELRARGIPEYARRLAKQYPMDPMKRKAERNPEELEFMNEVGRKVRNNYKFGIDFQSDMEHVAGVISSTCRDIGIEIPIIIGGLAVEIDTQGHILPMILI